MHQQWHQQWHQRAMCIREGALPEALLHGWIWPQKAVQRVKANLAYVWAQSSSVMLTVPPGYYVLNSHTPPCRAAGYRITACAATHEQAAFVLSLPKQTRLPDETQETLRTTQFPSQHVKVRGWSWGTAQLCGTLPPLLMATTIPEACALLDKSRPPVTTLTDCGSPLQEKWSKDLYISAACFGRTVC